MLTVKDVILKFPSKQDLFAFLQEIKRNDIVTGYEYQSNTYIGKLKDFDIELAKMKFQAVQVSYDM